jgi:hypothetical protein
MSRTDHRLPEAGQEPPVANDSLRQTCKRSPVLPLEHAKRMLDLRAHARLPLLLHQFIIKPFACDES